MVKLINEVKKEYNKRPIVTGFMGLVVILAVLTYIRPNSTSGFLSYVGFTAINFIFLAIVLGIFWWVIWRRRR